MSKRGIHSLRSPEPRILEDSLQWIRGFSMPGTISVRGQLEEQKTLGLLAGENWHTGRARERSDRKTIEKERYSRAQDTAIERVQDRLLILMSV